MCNTCIHKPVCSKYIATGGVKSCEHFKPVDAVSRGVHDQVRWERDVAIQQLEEHGIPFGGIAPDVVKAVRCKDCKYHEHYDALLYCEHLRGLAGSVSPNAFCSYGERKTESADMRGTEDG